MKISIRLCFSVLVWFGVTHLVNAQNVVSHNFNNGSLRPFEVCTTQNPNYARVINGRVKTFWTQTGFNGTRMDMGAEICGHGLGQWLTYKEGWCGMIMTLGPDYPKNKRAAVAQIMGRKIDIGWSTWSGKLLIDNGDLKIDYRAGGGTGNIVEKMVYPDFPYQKEVAIIIHFVLSMEGKGKIEVWVDGVSKYKANNISLGLGEFENDRQIPGLSRTIFKLGQYNFDTSNYTPNETRTVYYDNITWYNGANGYNIVNPNPSTVVHIRKRNATNFAIDGNQGGKDGQNVYLWSSNTSNQNQQWVEINRDGGFYTYQKAGTNYCIDGGKGGANRQNVYLWTCSANNQNQHWRKVSVGGGAFRLEKRNAPAYSLDGGSGGADAQNVGLYSSFVNSQNLHWLITPINTAGRTANSTLEAKSIYPNPFADHITISIDKPTTQDFKIMNHTGKTVLSGKVDSSNNIINTKPLVPGLYTLIVIGEQQVQTFKLIKE